jgi:Chromo (CHRromatin Organisation MOdifier) domain
MRREVLVKWTGYTDCTWEPRANLEHTVALDEFKTRYGSGDGVGEEVAGAMIGPRRKPRGRNARLLMLGAASWEWLRREGTLIDL